LSFNEARMRHRYAILLPGLLSAVATLQAQTPSAAKRAAVAIVEQQRAQLITMSDQIWSLAETALREEQSASVLADYAEKNGFTVQRGIAGMPSAFVASFGSGRPIIAILGEYDALPGISQKATAIKEALQEGAAGHGCGHNLFGAASLGSAVAIKRLIADGKLTGTVRFYGTPAEESIGGKIYMIREGLFKDVDLALVWHPGDETYADNEGFQSNIQFFVEFRGRTAHAAGDPWNGRSAADAAEAFTHGVNLLREHVRPTVRMHYTVQRAGDVPNVARLRALLTGVTPTVMASTASRPRQEIAEGAARIAGVDHTISIQTGYTDEIILDKGLKVVHDNLTWLGPPSYTEDELTFARALQRATGRLEVGMSASARPLRPILADPPGGSSDVGDVSWVVPTVHFYAATAPKGVPWHAWPVVASSGMSIGHKGMMVAASALSATAVDFYENTAAREAVRSEWATKAKGLTYKWYVPDGPPPLPKR
jgi:aminobenzoyl-glutamate utilization protein B